jgi:hypothetical protein
VDSRRAMEAPLLTAVTLNCRQLHAQLIERCPGCDGPRSLLPSLPSARIACIFFDSACAKYAIGSCPSSSICARTAMLMAAFTSRSLTRSICAHPFPP